MKDFFGNEIHVGDIIVYPGRHSSSLWMTVAIVVAFEPRTETRSYSDQAARCHVHSMGKSYDDEWSTPRKTYTERTDRAVIITSSVPSDVAETLREAAAIPI